MSMEMAMTICMKESEDKQTIRKRKRKKVDLFVFLPDDILLDILKRLHEPFLGYRAKYVCRRWFDLISKWILLDSASFVLQGLFTASHMGIREEGEGLQVKVKDLDIPQTGMIRSWGNEFLLISNDKWEKTYLHVYNLLTKEGSYLPKCNASCGRDCFFKCGVAISFNRFKGIYKVVHLFPGPPIECHILILRKDIVSSKWKKIQVPCMNKGRVFSHNPVSVQGRYIHWGVYNDKHLISIDTVKEEIVDWNLSLHLHGDGSRRIIFQEIFEMGGSLALFVGVSEDKAEIWILKDFQRNKWGKLHSFSLKNNYHERIPVFGVISRNSYIILESKSDDKMWYCDMKNGVVKNLDIYIDSLQCCVIHSSPPSF